LNSHTYHAADLFFPAVGSLYVIDLSRLFIGEEGWRAAEWWRVALQFIFL
jgi:hypothetical protein